MSCNWNAGGWNGADYYDELDNLCDPSSPVINPSPTSVNIYGSPVNTQTQPTGGVFNTTIAAILSGLAILKKAPYIPTANNPYNQPTPTIIAGGLGGGGNYGGGGIGTSNSSITAGTVGKVEAWIKKNPGVSGMLAVGAVLYFMKPSQRTGR